VTVRPAGTLVREATLYSELQRLSPAKLAEFQKAEGLEDDGIWGPHTASAAKIAEARRDRIDSVSVEGNPKTLILETHASRMYPAMYALYDSDGVTLKYRGSDANELRAVIVTETERISEALYVDATSYPPERLAALRSTLGISDAAQLKPRLRITLLDGTTGLAPLTRGIRLELVRDIESLNGDYSARVEFSVPVRQPPGLSFVWQPQVMQPLITRVVSTTLAILAEFLQFFSSLFEVFPGPAVRPESLAAAVHMAKVELARRHGLSEQQLAEMLRVEFGSIELVRRSRSGLQLSE
jgi:hypothetical protein